MKNPETLEALIRDKLNDNETVLWSGKPFGVKLLEAPFGSPIIVRWIICLVIAVVALWYGLIYVPGNDSVSTNGTAIMLVILVIVIFFAIRPLMDISRLNGKCFYFITDRRALVLVKGNSETVKERSLADLSEITMDTISEGRGNIYIGTKAKNSEKRARFSVLVPPQIDENEEKPLVFYSVANPDEVIGCFPTVNNND